MEVTVARAGRREKKILHLPGLMLAAGAAGWSGGDAGWPGADDGDGWVSSRVLGLFLACWLLGPGCSGQGISPEKRKESFSKIIKGRISYRWIKRYSKGSKDCESFNPFIGTNHSDDSVVDIIYYRMENWRGSFREDEDRIFLDIRNGPIQQVLTEWQDNGLVHLNITSRVGFRIYK